MLIEISDDQVAALKHLCAIFDQASSTSHVGEWHCPTCGSEDCSPGSFEFENDYGVDPYVCHGCGCKFHDIWVPVERVITEEGKPDVD